MCSLSSRRGYTLLEVLIVLSMLAILAALGVGSMREHLPRYRLVQTAKQFKSDMMQLRQIAVQNNREARMRLQSAENCSDNTVWGGEWVLEVGDRALGSTTWDILPEDRSDNGVDDQQGEGLINIGPGGNQQAKDICMWSWSGLAGPSDNGANNADSVVFSPRGWLRNPSSDFQSSGYLEFQFVNQEAAREGIDDSLVIQISRAGLVRLVASPTMYPQNSVGIAPDSSQ